MSAVDRSALEALRCRLDHTAAISRLIAIHTDAPPDTADAIRGVAETLNELAERMDGILNPTVRTEGR